LLEDLLEGQEVIVFRSDFHDLKFTGVRYDELAITNQRIVFYIRTGLLFKKDKSASISLKNIQSLNFHEKGVIRKKGELKIILGDTAIPLEGDLSSMKHLYENLVSLVK